MVCLICAVFAWLFFALFNKTFKWQQRILVFKNLPLNKSFYPLQSDTVWIQVETNGWEAIFTRLHKQEKKLEVDLNLLGNKNYIVLSQYLTFNTDNYRRKKNIKVQPDTILFDFTKRKEKKIPVKLISVISYQKQYNQSACVELNPKMVTLIGPEIELNKINFWPTQLLKTSKTNVNISKNISLFKPFKNNISVYPSVVKVKIPVEEFTEKILDIPIKVTNNPNYYNVKLFPNKVSIKVLVPLSRFHKLSADDFEAKVDLNLWAIYHVDKLSVKVSNYATYTRIVQVEPHQINYIIKK